VVYGLFLLFLPAPASYKLSDFSKACACIGATHAQKYKLLDVSTHGKDGGEWIALTC
jgi:hypothetical protein